MLISIVLALKSAIDVELPASTGRANYAAALRAISSIDRSLAEQTHEGDGPKALTCSAILEGTARRDTLPVYAGRTYTVRLTGLTGEVSRALKTALVDNRPMQWELSSHKFEVTDVICDPARNPWTGMTTYEELAAACMIRMEPDPQVTIEFATPTAFKSMGLTMPMPLPNMVFGSLVERWNAFSTVPLAPEMRQFGGEGIAVSRYKMESFAVNQKNSGLRIGGIGQTTYRAVVSDRYFQCVMQMLAHFAMYSGIGVQTATGMGQARRLEWKKRDDGRRDGARRHSSQPERGPTTDSDPADIYQD